MKIKLTILLVLLSFFQSNYSKNKTENKTSSDLVEEIFSKPINRNENKENDELNVTEESNTFYNETSNSSVYKNSFKDVDRNNTIATTNTENVPMAAEREKYGINTSSSYKGWEKDLELAKRQEKIDIVIKVVWGIVITALVIASVIFIKNLLLSED